MSSLRKGRKGSVLLTLLLVAVVVVSIVAAYAWLVSPRRQGVMLRIKLVDSEGEAVPYAVVRVFLLTNHGPTLLGESRAHRCGEVIVHVFVPRVWVGFKEAPYAFSEEVRRPIYASVNLEVFAVGLDPKGLLAGVRVFSVNPTYMRWPEDSVGVTVRMQKVPGSGGGAKVRAGIVRVKSSWQYTPILKYSAWDWIQAWLNVRTGSEVVIESKGRICGAGRCGSWRSAGSTQVTIDHGFIGGNLTGEFVRTLYVKFKYVDYTYCDPGFSVCEGTVYAADTFVDPSQRKCVDRAWDGRLPTSPYTMYVLPGDMRIIPILGGHHWELFTNISIGSGESITLGVTYARAPSPESFLYVKAGPGHGLVKIVTPHGPDPGSYVVTYCGWNMLRFSLMVRILNFVDYFIVKPLHYVTDTMLAWW